MKHISLYSLALFLILIGKYCGCVPNPTKTSSTQLFSQVQCEDCPSRRQSPINIDDQVVRAMYCDLEWSPEYQEIPLNITLTNTGSTVMVRATFSGGRVPILSGGPLLRRYKFAQLHFHWGTNNSVGSPHTVFNEHFPMEIHAVHVREDLTREQADNYFDGNVLLTYFVEFDQKSNNVFNVIAEHLQELNNLPTVSLRKLFTLNELMPKFSIDYYTYSGSKSEDPFTESVIWIIPKKQVRISTGHLNLFRELAQDNPAMINNFRSTQPLNGRHVHYVTCL